jgi:hypothetical protein
MASMVGMSYHALVDRIMESALTRVAPAQARPARVAA